MWLFMFRVSRMVWIWLWMVFLERLSWWLMVLLVRFWLSRFSILYWCGVNWGLLVVLVVILVIGRICCLLVIFSKICRMWLVVVVLEMKVVVLCWVVLWIVLLVLLVERMMIGICGYLCVSMDMLLMLLSLFSWMFSSIMLGGWLFLRCMVFFSEVVLLMLVCGKVVCSISCRL